MTTTRGRLMAMLIGAIGMAAQASPELARTRLCMGCHAVDRKLVGPAWRDVAARYSGQADAIPRLADHIQHGSKGVWGPVPMPASPKVTADEARQLAAWVMTLR